jgi:hypothetical protein
MRPAPERTRADRLSAAHRNLVPLGHDPALLSSRVDRGCRRASERALVLGSLDALGEDRGRGRRGRRQDLCGRRLHGRARARNFYPATGRWSRGAEFPRKIHHAAAVGLNNKLYVIGGFADGGWTPTDAAYEYDPAVDRWESKAPLPTARSGIAAASLVGRIFVLVGEAPIGTFAEVEAYDPITDSWSSAPPLPTPRHGLGAAVVVGKLYVLSGGPKPGASASSANEVLEPADH